MMITRCGLLWIDPLLEICALVERQLVIAEESRTRLVIMEGSMKFQRNPCLAPALKMTMNGMFYFFVLLTW
jgi:hypothetical protein